MISSMGFLSIVIIAPIIVFLIFAIKQTNIGKLEFKHPEKSKLKIAPVGYSWTTMIFGFFPALLRGHFIAALIILPIAFIFSFLGSGLLGFVYNKWFVKHLVRKGYSLSSFSGDLERIKGHLKMESLVFED